MRFPRLRLLPSPPSAAIVPRTPRARSASPSRAARPAFHPTALQRQFLDLLAQGMLPHQAGARLNISRMTFYRWRQDPAFRHFLAAAQLRDFILDGGSLLTIARAKAETHFPYWKALAQLTFTAAAREDLADWAEWCASDACAGDLADPDLEATVSAVPPRQDSPSQALAPDPKM